MPLARIITPSPQAAQELTAQLHARGFVVEVVSPENIVSTPADLVIRLDECSVEEALSATARNADRSTNVFIAPGAIAGERPAAAPVARPVNHGTAADERATTDPKIELQRGDPVTEGSTQSYATTAQEPETYVYQDAVLSPLQRLRLPRVRAPKLSMPRLRFPHFSVPRLSMPHMRVPRVQAPKLFLVRMRPQLSRFTLPRIRLPRMCVPDFSSLRVRLAQIQVPKLFLPALRFPRISLRRPEFRFPARLMQAAKLRWQLPRIGVRLPRPNLRIHKPDLRKFPWPKSSPDFSMVKARLRVAKLRLQKAPFSVPRVKWRARLATIPKFSPAMSSVSIWRSAATLPRKFRTDRVSISSATFWDTAIAIGILAVCALLVGGLLHSKTPLPARLTQGSASNLPFAQAKPNLAAAAPVAHATEIKKPERMMTPERAALQKPSPQVTQRAAKVSHSKPKHRVSSQVATTQRPRSSDGDADFVAEDVVVHYANKN
jgi:hypothetical protein